MQLWMHNLANKTQPSSEVENGDLRAQIFNLSAAIKEAQDRMSSLNDPNPARSVGS